MEGKKEFENFQLTPDEYFDESETLFEQFVLGVADLLVVVVEWFEQVEDGGKNAAVVQHFLVDRVRFFQ